MYSQQKEDGLFDRNGFYFRQRRGHLNLRKFESLDLERIIREVDVDLLQQSLEEITFSKFSEHEIQFFSDKQVVKLFNLAQLTIEYLLYSQEKLVGSLNDLAKKYHGKKRALHQKRKEMNSLKEESSSLQQQLKAKRRNLATLEKVVREANEVKSAEPPKPKQSPFLKFFMTLPDGLFVEFEELRDTTIRQLLLILRNALSSHRSQKLVTEAGDHIRLFLKGKLLILDHSLEQCGLRDGDTILVNITEDVVEKKAEVVTVPETKVDNSHNVEALLLQQKVLDAVEKQLTSVDTLTAELKKGIAVDVKDFISDRLSEELAKLRDIAQPLPQKVEPAKAAPQAILGDLENDGEDNSLAIQEINMRLLQSNLRMTNMDSHLHHTSMSMSDLKELLRLQQEQLAELRKALLERQSNQNTSSVVIYEAAQPQPQQSTIIIQQPQPQPQPQPVVTQQQIAAPSPEKVKPKSSLHQLLDVAPKTFIEKKPVPNLVAEEIKAAETPVRTIVEIEPVQVIAPKKEVVKEVPKVEVVPKVDPVLEQKVAPPVIAEEKQVEVQSETISPALVTVRFPADHFVGYVPPMATDVVVELEADLQVVDIIFEVRKAVANQMNLPFKSTCLSMDQRAVKLGVDIDDSLLPFGPLDAQRYAASGRLTIKFERVQLLTNDKIDRITPAWELSSASSKALSASSSATVTNASGTADQKSAVHPRASSAKDAKGQSSGRVRRSYEDEESFGEDEKKRGFKAPYASVRQSFDSMLRDLSTRKSLTDEELTARRKELEATSASDSEGHRKMRASLAQAMTAIAVDSGSESAQDDFFRQSVRMSRDHWKSVTTSSPDFLQLRSRSLLEQQQLQQSTGSFGVASALDDERRSPADLSRSFSVTRRSTRRSYEDDDFTPMLSSLNAPLRFADTHDFGSMNISNNQSNPRRQPRRFDAEDEGEGDGDGKEDNKYDREDSSKQREELFDSMPSASWQSHLHSHHQQQSLEDPAPSFVSSVASKDASALFSQKLPAQQHHHQQYQHTPEHKTQQFSAPSSRKNSPPDDDRHQDQPPGRLSSTLDSAANTRSSAGGFDLSSTLDSDRDFKFSTQEIRARADQYERTGSSGGGILGDSTTEFSGLDTTIRTDDGDEDDHGTLGVSKGSSDSPFKDLSQRRPGGGYQGVSTASAAAVSTSGLNSADQTHDFDNMSTTSLAISATSD